MHVVREMKTQSSPLRPRPRAPERLLAFAALFLAIATSGCHREEEPALSERVQGWWTNPSQGTCYCPPQAECQAGDCASYSVVGFLPDGKYFDGQIAYSKSAGTMSSMGELPSGTYRVDAATIVVSQPKISDASLPAKMTGDRLQLGTRIVTRAPQNLSAGLTQAVEGGTTHWSSFPVPR